MSEIALDDFDKWSVNYRAAWQAGDAYAAIELFSADSEYYENPFDPPNVGKDAIHRYWGAGTGDSQNDVHFKHGAIAVIGSTGMAQWQATFVRVPSQSYVELDGFLLAEFDGSGHCSVFR